MQLAMANGTEQGLLQPPQLAMLVMKSKPSSATPLQSLSRPSQASTPPLLFTHSQPFFGSLSASKNPATQVYWQTPPRHCGLLLGAMQMVKHLPQFAMSVRRS